MVVTHSCTSFITDLFNLSSRLALIVPAVTFKEAIITPVIKKKTALDVTDPSNYHSFSTLLGKLFVRVVADQIASYLCLKNNNEAWTQKEFPKPFSTKRAYSRLAY